jgi:GNAT superfamily N-acetyltransferase
MERPPHHPLSVEHWSERHEELDAFLSERIYEFNSRTTGIFDGELFACSFRDPAGAIIAGVSGHTWGGCCEIKHLWVHEGQRGLRLGTALMQTAEAEAVRRGCTQIVLTTHDFQAPSFYERLGYTRRAAIADDPRGHFKFVYVKPL